MGTMTSLPVNFRRVAALIGIFVLVFIVLEFNRRLEDLKILNSQNAVVRVQLTQAVQTQVALQTEVAFAGSVNAVEHWARVDGHYIQDGDLPVVPIGQPGDVPIISSTPTPVPTQMANWEIWWSLFFGE